MKHLLNVHIPTDTFDNYVRDGIASETIEKILNDTNPEEVYFTEENGKRGAILIINIDENSDIPRYTEPWFLKFNADCEIRSVMDLQDLRNAGLEEIGVRWK